MKAHVWGLALGVICLLQHSVSAEPRPDFSLTVEVKGSVRVSEAVDLLSGDLDTLLVELSEPLSSMYPGLQEFLTQLQELGQTTNVALLGVMGPLSSLVLSDDPMEFGAFDATLGAITSVQDFFENRYLELVTEFGEFVGNPLPAQFDDAVERIDTGLSELSEALLELKGLVNELLFPGSPEEGDCPVTGVPRKLVTKVTFALRNLRAYLPLLAYLLSTTGENIVLIDEYLVRLSEETDAVLDISQYVELLNEGLMPLAPSIADRVLSVQTNLTTVSDAISELTQVQTVESFSRVQSALETFEAVLNTVGELNGEFSTALMDITDGMVEVLTPDNTIPTVDNARVVRTLLRTLLSNGPYSRYCFYKYSELLFGFADQGLAGVEECIDKEVSRLHVLQHTMFLLVDALNADFEDLADQLTVCENTQSNGRRRTCVNRVAAEYSDLAENYESKFEHIFQVGVTEARASKFRLRACIRTLQSQLIDDSNTDLRREIRKCRKHGPFADQLVGEEEEEEELEDSVEEEEEEEEEVPTERKA